MIISILLIMAWVAIATYGDVRFKAASGIFLGPDFAIGMLSYLATGVLAVFAFPRQQWGWTILLWNSLSLLLSICLSVWIFHEPLTAKRAIATGFVLTAIMLAD